MPDALLPRVRHRVVRAAGVPVSVREAQPYDGAAADAPTLLLLHGFPSGAHQYRRLIDALATRYRVLAPDYPGFGPLDPTPPPRGWTFEGLTDVVEALLVELGETDVVLYLFDWGGPVGFRLALRRPSWVRGFVVQNANAYDEGLSDAARAFIALEADDPATLPAIEGLLQEGGTRGQYETGLREAAALAPESWLLDQAFLDRGERTAVQVELALDYKSNLAEYAAWQAWLAAHRPPTLVVWGRHDPFFTVPGALAYARDVPDADVHLLDTGHFALEERVQTVALLVDDFLRRRVGARRVSRSAAPSAPCDGAHATA